EAAAYYLAMFDQPYAARTVIAGIRQLPASHRASWTTEAGWTVAQAAPVAPAYRRSLPQAADPVASFEAALEAAISRLFPNQDHPLAAALSGGLDSALVAGAAARRGRRVASFGLLLPAPDAAAQAARRR